MLLAATVAPHAASPYCRATCCQPLLSRHLLPALSCQLSRHLLPALSYQLSRHLLPALLGCMSFSQLVQPTSSSKAGIVTHTHTHTHTHTRARTLSLSLANFAPSVSRYAALRCSHSFINAVLDCGGCSILTTHSVLVCAGRSVMAGGVHGSRAPTAAAYTRSVQLCTSCMSCACRCRHAAHVDMCDHTNPMFFFGRGGVGAA